MARYKPVDRHLSKLLPVNFAEQIVPGTFEYALNWLVDHQIDLSVFEARHCNDEVGAAAYHPAVLLKIVLFGYVHRYSEANRSMSAVLTRSCGSGSTLTRVTALAEVSAPDIGSHAV